MLTKSNYLLGLQCPKLLWNKKHNFVNFPEVSEVDKAKIREALERYCELDTLAEVEIVKGLRGVLKDG